jgi:hypothetical protein
VKFVVATTLCLPGVAVAAGWYWQNPRPTGNSIVRIWFANADTGCAAGRWETSPCFAVVFRTTDSRATWDTFAHPTRVDVNDICFPTSLVGCAGGGDCSGTMRFLMKTTDCGVNWVGANPIIEDGWAWAFAFVGDTTQGRMVGDNGAILSTSPGLGGTEGSHPPQASSPDPATTIVGGVLFVPADGRQNTAYRAELPDVTGRKVMNLMTGANDAGLLAPSVYFVREQPQAPHSRPQAVRKVVRQR